MSNQPDPKRQQIGRYGAYVQWSREPDRTGRTRKMRAASPGQLDYWLARLDPERFAAASEAQKMAAAESAKKAHFARLSMKSAEVRSARKMTE